MRNSSTFIPYKKSNLVNEQTNFLNLQAIISHFLLQDILNIYLLPKVLNFV